jgi:hypothetical protein
MPGVEIVNKVLDNLGSGEWTQYVSVEQMGSLSKIGLVIIILIFLLSVIATYANKKGTFTRPDVSSAAHVYEIVNMVNAELEGMYHSLRQQGILKRATEGFGGLSPSHLIEGRLDPAEVSMKSQFRMNLFVVFRFHLNDMDAVANGKFGSVSLNKAFFTTRTQHHRYALMIASELILFQLYALSGKDPKEIANNESFRKKHGEVIISLTGKIEEYAAMNERGVWSLTKHDRKVDDSIASFLGLTSREVAATDADLKQFSRSAHDIIRGDSHIFVPEDNKLRRLLDREIRDFERLVRLSETKLEDVKKLMSNRAIAADQRADLYNFSNKWEPEVARLRVILSALVRIRDSTSSWRLKDSWLHQFHRARTPETGAMAEALTEESDKGWIDINKVHALLTAFTATKAEMIHLMQFEEAAV